MPRLRTGSLRVIPPLFLLALYWPGLTNWFYQDDFGWLNLRHDVHSAVDLLPALFAPKAHGNIRPLGENAYFLLLSSIFGVDALPFRIVAFATQIGSLLLIGSIARRLTKSRAAELAAPMLWIANPALAPAMCWTSIYNQVLSGFFFLLAFWFLLRSIETGAARDTLGHWTAFILGLGALESNVVYPALAACYALLFARRYLMRIAPMFLVSALFVFAHFRAAPPATTGVYALHPGPRMLPTLATYWIWALGHWWLAAVVLTAALLTAAARQRIGLFGVAWFVMVIAPYLPLPDHLMDYYLTVPTAGLALAGAAAITYAWRARWIWRSAAIACASIYLAVCVPAAWRTARWHHDRGARVEELVLGVADVHTAEPGKIILLDGIDSDLFWSGIVDLPFRALEIPHVYLAPASDARIQAPPGLLSRYILPEELTLRALASGRAVVYQSQDSMLANITSRYQAVAESTWKIETPRFINLGDSAFADYVGAGWDRPADGYRFLRRAGTATVGTPHPGERLYIGVFRSGSFRLDVAAAGIQLPTKVAQSNTDLTELSAPLPPTLTGKSAVTVLLTNGDPAPLKFGYLEVR